MSPRRPNPLAARAACAVLLGATLVAGTLSACATDPTRGYAFASTYDERVATVAVPVWGNDTFSYGIEAALTESLIKQVQSATPWRVTDADTADTTLTGTITRAELRPISTDPITGLGQEYAVRLTVDFTWVDNRTGEQLVRRQNFSASGSFVPAYGTGERLEIGETATLEELAREVVGELRSRW
ncbi:MAG: LptE family protein [Phycisphaerales bacterium]|jgi:hypothetical protein|nr:LptE family protein [Phycisphaerales bacterium]